MSLKEKRFRRRSCRCGRTCPSVGVFGGQGLAGGVVCPLLPRNRCGLLRLESAIPHVKNNLRGRLGRIRMSLT